MLHFLEAAAATGTQTPTSPVGFGASSILMMVGLLVVLYFLMIRPESKRKKAAEQMRSEVKVGDEITTIGGIVGKVVNVKDDKIVLETGADQVRIEFNKWAISSNETATAAAQEAQKKALEARAKAKAEKKAEKSAKKAEK